MLLDTLGGDGADHDAAGMVAVEVPRRGRGEGRVVGDGRHVEAILVGGRGHGVGRGWGGSGSWGCAADSGDVVGTSPCRGLLVVVLDRVEGLSYTRICGVRGKWGNKVVSGVGVGLGV